MTIEEATWQIEVLVYLFQRYGHGIPKLDEAEDFFTLLNSAVPDYAAVEDTVRLFNGNLGDVLKEASGALWVRLSSIESRCQQMLALVKPVEMDRFPHAIKTVIEEETSSESLISDNSRQEVWNEIISQVKQFVTDIPLAVARLQGVVVYLRSATQVSDNPRLEGVQREIESLAKSRGDRMSSERVRLTSYKQPVIREKSRANEAINLWAKEFVDLAQGTQHAETKATSPTDEELLLSISQILTKQNYRLFAYLLFHSPSTIEVVKEEVWDKDVTESAVRKAVKRLDDQLLEEKEPFTSFVNLGQVFLTRRCGVAN